MYHYRREQQMKKADINKSRDVTMQCKLVENQLILILFKSIEMLIESWYDR